MANYEGYCVKCREKREFDGQDTPASGGRAAGWRDTIVSCMT
jgi:hypothetical protein